MKFLKLLIINLLLLTVFACSETQPFNNPYDPAVDPDDWAPTELTYTVIDVNSIKLDWVVNCNIEAGFIIERKVNTGSWTILADLASNTTTYTDNTVNDENNFYYRIYAYVAEYTSSYSNETTVVNICIDIDGNVYQTVMIGNQEWMAENLKVTHYRNGDAIPTGLSSSSWANTTSGAYAVYNDNESYADTYGYLYNWYTVDDSRGIAPEGWHIASDEEWTELTDYLGSNAGSQLAGRADLWYDGNLENNAAFGTSGFNGLPGGFRSSSGYYGYVSYSSYFWSSTVYSVANAWNRLLNFLYSGVYRSSYTKRNGFSLRCVRD